MITWQKIWTLFGIAIVVLIAMSLSGCRTQQPVVIQSQATERTEKVVPTDTVIVTKPDSAAIRALFECDSLNNVVLRELETAQGERIKPNINIQHNEDGSANVQFDCKEDSLRHEITLLNKIIEENTKTVQTTEVRYVPDYYRNCTRGFWVLFVVAVIFVGAKGVQLYLRFQSGGLGFFK